MKDLEGRNALLTGAAGGIGHHIAEALADRGVNLVVSGRNESALSELRDSLKGKPLTVEIVSEDLSDLKSAGSLVARAEEALGPIDILVNNAGIGGSPAADQTVDEDEMIDVITINLLSPMLLTRAALPGMLERNRGHVVNMSSMAGKMAVAYTGVYAAAKAGLAALTQSLRAEVTDAGVGLSVICPGFVRDEGMFAAAEEAGFQAPKRVGTVTPEQVADAVVKAIIKDDAEVLVSARAVRPLLAVAGMSPKAGERMIASSGINRFTAELASAAAAPAQPAPGQARSPAA
jgi:short-subunit dehydrogenase